MTADATVSISSPEVADIVQRCREGLHDVAEQADSMLPALRQGESLARVRGMTPQHLQGLVDLAENLCEEERFEDAMAVASQLVFHAPTNGRYLFLSATCAQRMGHTREAVALFAASLLAEESAETTYRLGECLMALGETRQAGQAFEAAVDLGRGDDEMRHVQDGATDAIRTINAAE